MCNLLLQDGSYEELRQIKTKFLAKANPELCKSTA